MFSIGSNDREVWCPVTGLRIPYDGAAGFASAKKQIERHQEKFIESVEKRLGRKLTDSEKMNGKLKVKEMDHRERIALESKWGPILKPKVPVVDENPHEKALKEHFDEIEKKKDPWVYMTKQAAIKWEADRQARESAEQLAARRAADPAYQSTLRSAKALLTRLQWTEEATAKDLFEAGARLQLAADGRTTEYESLTNEWKTEFQTRCEILAGRAVEAVEAAKEQADRLTNNLSLNPDDFN